MNAQTVATVTGAMTDEYKAFLRAKSQANTGAGFRPVWLPEFLFDFQSSLTEWAVVQGRAALLEDCGTGKSVQELVWAENVVRHTNGRVLLLTPLAVGAQFITEAEKFGIEATRSPDGKVRGAGIYIANYERLHYFDPADFAGVVCDESSILKGFDGVTRARVTEFMRERPYRLLGTATAAPNDTMELGTSSEALGYLGHMDMLGRFFKNDLGNSTASRGWGGGGGPKWRFKGHAEKPFWQWVCSWARAMRRPSDLGFDDGKFVLPPMTEREHVVSAKQLREGMLFAMEAHGLSEQREERKRTMIERCERAASLAADTGESAVVWCHTNPEGDLLTRLIPGAVQVSGKDADEEKEAKFAAFQSGEARVLVTKPVIGAWGLNWQHCAHQVTFASNSFEQDYQCIRRSWRFGQKRPVVIDRVISDGESAVLANLRRKAAQADRMFDELVAHMRDGMKLDRDSYGSVKEEMPQWL